MKVEDIYAPADLLEGVTLASGWVIERKFIKPKGGTGGHFGTCYFATRNGESAFIKALDLRRALAAPNRLIAIAALANEFSWEKEAMEFCAERRMSKVVTLVSHESVFLPGDESDPTKQIDCLILEVGDGDLRKTFDIATNSSVAWRLFIARDIALALDQLHRNGVAHLDVKPSNVISMKSLPGSPPEAKLGDLARVVRKNVTGPFDGLVWPGDSGYAPPEKIYGMTSAQWNDEREAADAYLLGSLLVFLFTGTDMTTLLMSEIPELWKPPLYRGNFDRQLLDVITQAQTRVFQLYVVSELGSVASSEILTLIKELTHPDPAIRGDPKARKSGVVGLDRYHQKFLRLAMKHQQAERIAK